MQLIVQRGGEDGRIAGGEGCDQQGDALDVEDGVAARNAFGQHRARFFGGQRVVRNHDREREFVRHFQPYGAGKPSGFDSTGHNGAEHAGGDVIGVAFEPRSLIQNARRFPAQT